MKRAFGTNEFNTADLFLRNFSCSASQQIPRLLWHSNVQYRVHESPPLFCILSQIQPVHISHPIH
jgi:hypothetical protein